MVIGKFQVYRDIKKANIIIQEIMGSKIQLVILINFNIQ